jgi:Protein of unknown function (DUF1648)
MKILMRRILEFVSLAALAVLILETVHALYGSRPLNGRIPTHYSFSGFPDAWGNTPMLWLLPAASVTLYLLMTWVSRHPAAFNYPVRVTPYNRERLEDLALSMVAWLKAELLCFFALIQWTLIGAARSPDHGLSSVPMPLHSLCGYLPCRPRALLSFAPVTRLLAWV